MDGEQLDKKVMKRLAGNDPPEYKAGLKPIVEKLKQAERLCEEALRLAQSSGVPLVKGWSGSVMKSVSTVGELRYEMERDSI